MANRKNSHRRRVRVAVLMVLCGAVFAAFFARLAWMQFVRADYYADKAAEASSASYTVTQHAARGAIVDSAGVVLARDTTVYDVYLRIPAPPGTDLRETVKAIESLTGSKDVETQLAAFFAAASAGELPVMQGVGSDVLTSFYKADLVQSGAVRAAARGVRTWPNGTLLPHALGFTGPITAEQWPTARRRGLAMDAVIGQSGLEAAYDDLLRGQDGRVLVNTGFDGAVRRTVPLREAAPGATLVLTVDSALQKELQNALLSQIEVLRTTKAAGAGRECRAGAAVVVDVQTGGILAAASVPGFDLNRYRSDYAALSADAAAPLLDRVCQGLYAPWRRPTLTIWDCIVSWDSLQTRRGRGGADRGHRPRRHGQLHRAVRVLQRLPAGLPAIRPRRAGRPAHGAGVQLQHLLLRCRAAAGRGCVFRDGTPVRTGHAHRR